MPEDLIFLILSPFLAKNAHSFNSKQALQEYIFLPLSFINKANIISRTSINIKHIEFS